MLDFSGDAEERHLVSTAGRTFDLEVVAVVHPEALETFDEQEIDGYDESMDYLEGTEPDWTSPVTVATKHATLGVSGPILDSEFLAIDDIRERSAIRGRRMFFRQPKISHRSETGNYDRMPCSERN